MPLTRSYSSATGRLARKVTYFYKHMASQVGWWVFYRLGLASLLSGLSFLLVIILALLSGVPLVVLRFCMVLFFDGLCLEHLAGKKEKKSYRSGELFVFLKLMLGCILEYCIQLWCPYLACDIDKLENVQRQATKLVIELTKLPYESSRNKETRVYSLYCQRKRTQLRVKYLDQSAS